ncbi:MAG: rhomboid family intramembrane serine protease [Hyphomicrobium sp.]
MSQRQPIFNVPFAVVVLLGIMIAVHLARLSLNEDDALWWLVALAFIPARYSGLANEIPGGDVASVTSFVSHMFVHADKVHLGINGAWLLAFGSVICRRIGGWRFVIFTLCCGFAGALLFLALHVGLMAPVIGASGAIAGLMGAVMRFLFPALDSREGWLLSKNPAAIPLMPLGATLRDRRAIAATTAFVALNLLAMIGFGSFSSVGTIAWEAHLGGYFFGLLTFGWFDIAPQRGSPTHAEYPTNVA